MSGRSCVTWSSSGITKRQAFLLLAAITALGAAFRYYNLGWGAPYYHFHMDEHFVLGPADVLRRDSREAAMLPKFFMYSPLMMYLINFVRGGYEFLAHPIDLTVPRDQVTYTVLSRAIAATFSTATIVVVYAIANKIAGRLAGLLAAFFLACAVLHLRDSHFATTDMAMTFFSALTIWWSLRVVEQSGLRGGRRRCIGRRGRGQQIHGLDRARNRWRRVPAGAGRPKSGGRRVGRLGAARDLSDRRGDRHVLHP